MEFFVDNSLIIFILPLAAALLALIAILFKYSLPDKFISYSTLVSTGIGLIFAAALYFFYTFTDAPVVDNSIEWFKVGDLTFSVGVFFDKVSVLFLLILMSVSILVQWFSTSYLKNDDRYCLYFFYLNLFNFSMAGLALSSNLPQTYVFWEAVGVCSYLLIDFYFSKAKTSHAARRVFIINRIGDAMFLSGIVVLIYFLINYPVSEGITLLSYSNLDEIAADFYIYLSDSYFAIACILLFGGAVAKSAQFPLHVWLCDAMQAPTPVSALIHAATMVAAGIFLSIRLFPLFRLSPLATDVILTIGLFTAFVCAFFAIAQSDIKKMLAYSTSSHLGLMIAAIGAYVPSAALFYLTSHAVAKALLFLCAGILIKCFANDSREMTDMKISRKNSPLLAYSYLIGVVSLSGLFFSGLFAKEQVFASLSGQNNIYIVVIFVLISLMSSYYLFKSYFIIFENKPQDFDQKTKLPISLIAPVVILAILTALVSFFNFGAFEYLNPSRLIGDKDLLTTHQMLIISLLTALIGLAVAAFAVFKKLPHYLPVPFDIFSRRGGYIDFLYEKIVDYIFDIFRNIAKVFDKYVIDALVNFTAPVAKFFAWLVCVFQNGNVQTYLSYSLFTVALLLSGFAMLFVLVWGI